jgi:uncharacterized membrane protein YfcA
VNVFEWFLFAASAAGGFVGSISGFGIGSLITPMLAGAVGMKLAVAIVAIPHFVGTTIRFWTLRGAVNRQVLVTFGIASAAGGLAGAFLHTAADSPILTIVFASLLVLAGVSGLTAWSSRWRFGRRMAWVAGAVSGVFGGMVGNQGGIRSAALLGFDLAPYEFVSTATAVAVMVDLCRLPVYLVTEWPLLRASAGWILISTVGVVAGTLAGSRALSRIPEARFRKIVSAIILALGVYMFTTVRT